MRLNERACEHGRMKRLDCNLLIFRADTQKQWSLKVYAGLGGGFSFFTLSVFFFRLSYLCVRMMVEHVHLDLLG